MKSAEDWVGLVTAVLLGIGYFGGLYALTTWAGRDAEARGVPGWVATCLVVLLFPLGPFLWVLFRPAVQAPPFDLARFRVQ